MSEQIRYKFNQVSCIGGGSVVLWFPEEMTTEDVEHLSSIMELWKSSLLRMAIKQEALKDLAKAEGGAE